LKKKLLIIGGVLAATLAIPSGVVLATNGVDGFQAFVEALKYGLKGLGRVF